MENSFQHYLTAKRSVDDRALNRVVWSKMADSIANQQKERELKILEVGAGIGTMFQRMVEWGALTRSSYLATDVLEGNIEQARRSIPSWARQLGYQVTHPTRDTILIEKSGRKIRLGLDVVDVYDIFHREESREAYDLLVAHAFLDLFDLREVLPQLTQLVCESGLMLFTINFDGDTIFEPVWDTELESEIIRAYHRSMDQRMTAGKPSGDSRAGRHLFKILAENRLEIVESGGSDWVVFPRQGSYPADEGYFLHFVLKFFEETLSRDPAIDQDALREWLEKRHTQVDAGELVYIAHQLDFLARKPF